MHILYVFYRAYNNNQTSLYYNELAIGTRSAVFSMKAAELKCQNFIVKKVCQVEHFKTFRKSIGPELGL